MFLSPSLHGERFGSQAAPAAGVAGARDGEAAEIVVADRPFVEIGVGGVGFFRAGGRFGLGVEAAFEPSDDAVVRSAGFFGARVTGLAEEDRLPRRFGEAAPRLCRG